MTARDESRKKKKKATAPTDTLTNHQLKKAYMTRLAKKGAKIALAKSRITSKRPNMPSGLRRNRMSFSRPTL